MTSNDVNRLEGDYILDSARYAIICSRFNDFIVNKLEAGAIDALKRHGTELTNIDVAYVPGALELGIAAQRLAATGRYDAIIALGAVIKGATAHFVIVIGESANALSQSTQQRRPQTRYPRHQRRADHQQHRTGRRTRRHQSGQQRRRSGTGRHRNGQPAAPNRLNRTHPAWRAQ